MQNIRLGWYLKDVVKFQDERAKSGDLEGALAAKAERERIATHTEPTQQEIDAMPEALRKLRVGYDPVLKKGEDEVARRYDTASRKYLADMDALQKRLTMGGDLDAAILVETEKDRFAAEMQKSAAGPLAASTTASDPAKKPATAAVNAKPLAEVLAGTKWLWKGSKYRVLEFRKDGKVDLDDWTRKGLVTAWEASGPNKIKLTIVGGRRDGNSATLEFSEDRNSFTGIDFDGHTAVSKSPRAEEASQ